MTNWTGSCESEPSSGGEEVGQGLNKDILLDGLDASYRVSSFCFRLQRDLREPSHQHSRPCASHCQLNPNGSTQASEQLQGKQAAQSIAGCTGSMIQEGDASRTAYQSEKR